MLIQLRRIETLLHCPGAGPTQLMLRWDGETLVAAERCGPHGPLGRYPIVLGQPALIDWETSLVPQSRFDGATSRSSLVARRWNGLRLLKGAILGNARVSRRNLRRFQDLARSNAGRAKPLVLMVGAGAAGAGTDILYRSKDIDQVAFDIYPTALTTFVADGHDIPLKDESVDAACIQAVLEHVLDPGKVVSEIFRVLKPGGIVYAETPFMQQVHEGAYDFTRFTELGHRWLFRRFAEIERGVIGGPGLSFYWSARYLAWGIVRNRALATLISAPFALFALLDLAIPPPRRIDGANGVYFLGKKSDEPLALRDLPKAYKGAQR